VARGSFTVLYLVVLTLSLGAVVGLLKLAQGPVGCRTSWLRSPSS
jgi:hypothetical protein